ncbi:MAG: agmatine deiminase family protein [Gammaproteobacteria bacterium]|nr:MAG: agmatine deiminase family protein [Gammaproteobacteria bacterium]
MPAEWEAHAATWLSWPHNRETWYAGIERVEAAMIDFAAALAESEPVYINVLDADHEAHVRRLLERRVPPERLQLFRIPTNDAWCRDHGAIFVTRPASAGEPLLAIDFEFNAWGGKYPPWDLDDAVPAEMAAVLGIPCFKAGMVLEGGSIDVNGRGALLTTEQCLLNPNRNPSLDRAAIEERLGLLLGIDQVIWLGKGIVGDDTDGHVDDITRFVAADTVVTAIETDPRDPNHAPLAANRERLSSVCLGDGRPLQVIELPMPEPVSFRGHRLPASYANFLITNRSVLMPAFAQPRDEAAREVLAHCFPGRAIVPLDSRELVLGRGALHCLSQQLPAIDQG